MTTFIRIFAVLSFFAAASLVFMVMAAAPGQRFTLFGGVFVCFVSGVVLLAAASAVDHLAQLPRVEAHLARLVALAARAEERATAGKAERGA